MSNNTQLKIAPQQLINHQDGNLTTTSLIIAEAFGKEHFNILRSIKNIECSDEFYQINFEGVEYIDKKGEKRNGYNITKDGFIFLVMGFTGKKAAAWKETFINAFNQMADQLKKPVPIEKLSRLEILQIAMKAEEEKQQLTEQVKEMQPAVKTLARIARADGSMCITNAAKDLQMRPKDLFAWLSENKWIYKRAGGGGGWIGYQEKIQQQLLEHKITVVYRSDGTEKTTEQVRITNKGITKISHFLNSLVNTEANNNLYNQG